MKRKPPQSLQVLALSLSLVIATSSLPLPAFSVAAQGQGKMSNQDQDKPTDENLEISEQAVRQIQSLIAEKESRTPAQKKIDSQLLYAIKQEGGEALTSAVSSLQVNVEKDVTGNVALDITGQVTKQVLRNIEELGGTIIHYSEEFEAIRATLPLNQIEGFAQLNEVRHIRLADRAYHNRDVTPPDSGNSAPPTARPANTSPSSSNTPSNKPSARAAKGLNFNFNPSRHSTVRPDFEQRAANVRSRLKTALPQIVADKNAARTGKAALMPALVGAITTQGDRTHRADEARNFFGVDGTGVKIGVISDGLDALPALQAAGELPAITVLPGQSGAGNGSEGTAMLEIIHDLAPGAQLFFATAFISQASFAQNILDLRAAGCDIIVDDIGYFREAVFQDDNVARAADTVSRDGALYFSAAGNENNKNNNNSGVWEGDFVDGGALTVGTTTLPGTVHAFAPGVTNNLVTQSNGGGAPFGLYWSDPLGGSGNDYDLYILNNAQTAVVSAATNVQDGNDDPVELTTISPALNTRVVILRKTGAAVRALHLNTFRGRLSINTESSIKGHPGSEFAFATAATPAGPARFGTTGPVGPFPNPHNPSNDIEPFSSDGPRRIFYNPDGTPVTPGCVLFACNGGVSRQKPEITAADGVSTATPGFNPFFGTSAAAPHATAIAALVKSAVPGITPAQIRAALYASAIDIRAPGIDRDSGYGIVMALEALQAVGAVPQPRIVSAGFSLVNESCPPENGAADPGERITVNLRVTNNGGAAASNLIGTLQPSANVIAPSEPQSFGAVAVGETVGRDFSFTVAGNCGDRINIVLQLRDGARDFGTFTYTLRLGSFTTNPAVSFNNPAQITIPLLGAATPYPSNIAVSGVTGTVSKVTVTLDGMSHTFPDDVDILLVGPQGQRVMLMSDAGGTADLNNVTLTFDDAAAAPLPDSAQITTGTYRPTDYGTTDNLPAPAPPRPYSSALSVFNGVEANGTWSLYVADDLGGDQGQIARGWSIAITTETGNCVTSCEQVRLETSTVLSRGASNNIVGTITVTNNGSLTANNIVLTTARLNAINGTPLPQAIGTLAPGASALRTVTFAGTSGIAAGTSVIVRAGGTYDGGSFNSSRRAVAP